MRIDQIRQNASDFNISLDSAIKMRVRYLQGLLGQWISYIDEQTNIIPESDMMAIIDELRSIHKYQTAMVKGVTLEGINDEMIQIARDYPIESLVEFRNGKATAFCHADKSPSLTWHKAKNKATCFPCGKSFNSLDICIERDNMTFVEAVKYLARR